MRIDAILEKMKSLTGGELAELKARMAVAFPDTQTDSDISAELKVELERRVAEANANPDAGIPWETIYEESLRRTRT